MTKIDIIDITIFANLKGGKLLSNNYTNSKEKLSWQCSKDHIWEATWNSIKSNRWCPHCIKPEISTLQQYAANKNGLLLSTEYKNNHTKLLWQCKESHQWYSRWNDIQTGYWCPHCAKNIKASISELQQHAIYKNGNRVLA